MPCRSLTYDTLKEAADKSHRNLVSKSWKEKEVKAYLKYMCFNTNSIDQLLKCARNCKKKAEFEAKKDVENLQRWKALSADNPDEYQKWQPPPIWDHGISIQQSTNQECIYCSWGLLKP